MAGGKPIRIAIVAEAKKAIDEVGKVQGALRDLGEATGASKLKNGLKNVAKGVAIGAGAAIAAVGALAVSTAKDLMRVERLGAQTEAVIKATGGAAGRSKAQVDALATNLERMSGAEAETVTEGQNMLLTFKNIKGDQFDKATKAMLDMGVAMNKGSLEGLDLKSTSIQLGKALNDPVKGITALSKVGVSFTDQQKEQIKAMTEAGDVAGAQGVILKELQGEFGGAAKAAGQTTEGMMAKVQNSFGNIAEEVFGFLLPIIQKVADFIISKVLPALRKFSEWMKGDGKKGIQEFGNWLNQNVMPVLKAFGDFIANQVVPALRDLGAWVVKNRDWLAAIGVVVLTVIAGWKIYVTTMAIVRAAMAAAAAAQVLFNVALTANPIGIIILAVAALAAGLVFFFTKTKTGQAIVKASMAAIKTAIKAVTDWWQNTAWPTIKAVWSSITGAFQQGKDNVTRFMKAALQVIKTVWKYTPLGLIISNWNSIMAWFGKIPGRVKSVFNTAINFIKTIWKYTPLGLIISNWGRIMDFFRGIPGKVKAVFNSAISWLKGAGRNILNGLKAGAIAGMSSVASWLGGIAGRVVRAAGNMGSVLYGAGKAILQGFLSGLKSTWGAVTDFVGGIADWIARNKGPLSYDKRLLIPAGKAIMSGLRKGLKAEMPKLKKDLNTVTNTIKGISTSADWKPFAVRDTSSLQAALATQAVGVKATEKPTADPFVISFEATGDPLMDSMLNELKKRIRINGGSAEKFLAPS